MGVFVIYSTQMCSEIKPTQWVYISLRHCIPNRDKSGTYNTWSYDSLPPIKINPLFNDLHTVQDVQTRAKELCKHFRSPTGCYFLVGNSTIFYVDQQWCIKWQYQESVGVYINDDTSLVVAKSIPEFLSRVHLEDRIWYNLSKKTKEEQDYIDFYKSLE